MNESGHGLASVGSNPTLINLLRVAQEDPTVRRQLIGILSLDSSQRVPLLRTLADQMQLEQKPREFVAALMSLTDDTIAATAMEWLRKESVEDRGLTASVPAQLSRIPKILVGIAAGGACPLALGELASRLLWFFFLPLPDRHILDSVALLLALLCVVAGARFLDRRSWRATVGAIALTGLLLCITSFIVPRYETRMVEFKGNVLSHRQFMIAPAQDDYILANATVTFTNGRSERIEFMVPRAQHDDAVGYRTVYRVDAVLRGRIKSREVTVYPDTSAPTHDPIPVGSPVRVRALEDHHGTYTAVSERLNPVGDE